MLLPVFELWLMLFPLSYNLSSYLVIFFFLREACFDTIIPTNHIHYPTLCFYNTLYFSFVAFLSLLFIFISVLFDDSSTG